MIWLIGTRWKYSDVLSQGVLIGRNSCKERCTSHVHKIDELLRWVAGNNARWTSCPTRIIASNPPRISFNLCAHVVRQYTEQECCTKEADNF